MFELNTSIAANSSQIKILERRITLYEDQDKKSSVKGGPVGKKGA